MNNSKKNPSASLALGHAVCMASLALAVQQAYAATDSSTLETVKVNADQRNDALAPTQGYQVGSSKSASKTDTPLQDIPQAVSVVTRQQIEDQQARTISEALNYTPGVFTGAVGSTTRYDYIVLRGFSDHPTANEFLDGLRLFGDPDGYNTLQIDPYVVERLDVVRGPASASYGQAAPGGVVAITSKRPLQSDYHELSLTVGNHQQRSLGLDFGGAVAGRDDLSYRLVAKGSAADQQQNGASTERYVLAPSLNWKISDSTNLLLQAYLQKDPSTGYHGTLPYYGTVVPHNGKTISTSFNEGSSGDGMSRDQQYFGYQLEHRINDALTFRQQYRLQLSKTDLSQYSDVGWVSDSSDLLNRTYARSSERSTAHIIDNNLEARFSALGLRHTVLAGLDYQTSRNKGDNSYTYTGTTINPFNTVYDDSSHPLSYKYFDRKRDQTGVYLQDQMALDNWKLTAGLRHDQAKVSETNTGTGVSNSWDGGKTTGRLGLVYQAANGLSPYLSYSEGFDPSQAYATDTNGNVLKPMQSKQSEVGIRYQPSSDIQLSAAIYDLRQSNVAQYNATTFKYDPIGKVRSRGVELEANARLSPRLSLLAGYTYTDMEVTEGSNQGKTPYLAPAHKATAWLDYAFDSGINLGGGIRHTGWMWADSANTLTIPGVTLYDLRLRLQLGQFSPSLKGSTLQINANNLANKTYVASCYSSYACYYGEKRNISATLSYKW